MWWIGIGLQIIINSSTTPRKNWRKNDNWRFAGILGSQLIQNAARLSDVELRFLSPVLEDCNLISVPTNVTDSTLSSISGEAILSCAPIQSEMDVNNMIHHLVKLPLKVDKSGRKRYLSSPCTLCKEQGIRHDVTVYCLTCGESLIYCYDINRDCILHVIGIRRATRSSTR